MKRRTLFLIFAAVIVISLAVPAFGFKDWTSYFDNVVSLLGALGTVYALFIAILLFDRFSIEVEVLSKQHEAVATLAQNLNISFMYVTTHTFDSTEYYIWQGNLNSLDDIPRILKEYSLRFTPSVYKRLSSITSGVQLMYLPDDIYSNCAKLLKPRTGGFSQTENVYFVVIRGLNPWSYDESKPEELDSFDNLLLSTQEFGDFCQNLAALNRSIEMWFKNHGYRNPRLQTDDIVPMKLRESHYNSPSPRPDKENGDANKCEDKNTKERIIIKSLNHYGEP